jgi:hypothetical protein
LPFAILVKAKKQKKRTPTIADGTPILTDFDKTMKTANPANIQKMAVLVPDANILMITSMPMIIKNNLSVLILVVSPIIIKATAAAAALHP